jgi:large subunit ribosomal protein L15
MRLNEIKDKVGARKVRVRIGRGIGSGVGKQGGRGGKGQTARSGVAIGGFEGGQMPLHRRLPKRGFNKWRRKDFNEVNVGALQQAIDDKRLDAGKPVDLNALVAAGIVRRAKDGLRLLGSGEITAKLSLTVNHASGTAKAAIEKAGGSIKVIEKKVLAADEAKRKKTAAKKAAAANKTGGGTAKKPAGDATEE